MLKIAIDSVSVNIFREEKARQVLKDALHQKPKKISSNNPKLADFIAEELSHGYVDDIVGFDYHDYQDKFCEREGIVMQDMYDNPAWMQAFYKEYENLSTRLCLKKAYEFMEQHDRSFMYIFNYGDEDGEFMSEMEHGGTFKNLPHITISKH